jgi:hypothetical protein
MSTTLSQPDIYKPTWTFPDGVTRNQVDHVLKDKNDIQIYYMSDPLEKLTVILTTTW